MSAPQVPSQSYADFWSAHTDDVKSFSFAHLALPVDSAMRLLLPSGGALKEGEKKKEPTSYNVTGIDGRAKITPREEKRADGGVEFSFSPALDDRLSYSDKISLAAADFNRAAQPMDTAPPAGPRRELPAWGKITAVGRTIRNRATGSQEQNFTYLADRPSMGINSAVQLDGYTVKDNRFQTVRFYSTAQFTALFNTEAAFNPAKRNKVPAPVVTHDAKVVSFSDEAKIRGIVLQADTIFRDEANAPFTAKAGSLLYATLFDPEGKPRAFALMDPEAVQTHLRKPPVPEAVSAPLKARAAM
jgi:hypothetical protein